MRLERSARCARRIVGMRLRSSAVFSESIVAFCAPEKLLDIVKGKMINAVRSQKSRTLQQNFRAHVQTTPKTFKICRPIDDPESFQL